MFIKANKLLGLPLKTSRYISRGGRPAAQRDGLKKTSFKMTQKLGTPRNFLKIAPPPLGSNQN